MTGKIFKSIFFVTLISLIIAAVAFYAVAYGNYRNTTEDELKRAAQFAAAGTELGGTEYLENLDRDGIRVTLVDPSGKVIFDNVSNSSEMGNHIGREEIAEALETGEGFARRKIFSSIRLSYTRQSHSPTSFAPRSVSMPSPHPAPTRYTRFMTASPRVPLCSLPPRKECGRSCRLSAHGASFRRNARPARP